MLFALLTMVSAGGCVVSRTCEKTLALGVTEYYAYSTAIMNNTVYEKDGLYYIAVKANAYRPVPAWLGLIGPPALIMNEDLIPQEEKDREVLLQITPEAKTDLCAPPPKREGPPEPNRSGSNPLTSAQIVPDPGIELDDAIKHPIMNHPTPEFKLSSKNNSLFSGVGKYLYSEKSGASYVLLPVAALGLAFDIPATVVMSAYFDFIILPGTLLVRGGMILMDHEI
ncbi:MAG: hypothetical protein AB7F32_02500 [Victivallaceae bacterium]